MKKAKTIWSLENGICLAALLFGIGFKFWLIQEAEIADDYHDPSEYVLQVLYPLNGGLGYGQGTGRFARIFYDLCIPYRWGIEVAFMAACLLALKALFDFPGRTYLPTALFLFILFDPMLMEQLSQMFSDQVWMLETLLGFTFMIFAVQQRDSFRWPWLILATIALGYSTITRSVFYPLMLALIFLTCLGLLILPGKRKTSKGRNRLAIFCLAMWSICLGVATFYYGTCLYDKMKFGFYGISAVDSNEYKDLFLCLQSVGSATGVPFCPVDKNRRSLIALAGPHSQWLMQKLDQDWEDNQAGLDQYGKYDIPSGQFDWAVYHAVMPVCQGDFQKTFAFFSSVEKEIADAKQRGAIPVRSILPLPDSRLGVVGKVYPKALEKTIAAMFYEPPPSSFLAGQNPDLYRYQLFDQALHRRAIHDSPTRNRIWAWLTRIYGCFYTPWMSGLCMTGLAIFFVFTVWRNDLLIAGSLKLLMRQLFIVMFFVLLGWYSLFVASGLPPLSRYTVYNHVMLFPLTAYAISQVLRMIETKNKDYRSRLNGKSCT